MSRVMAIFVILATLIVTYNAQPFANADEEFYKNSTTEYYPADMLNLVTLGVINGKKYLFARQNATWFEASYFCNAHGMDLVSIETQQENNLIMDHIANIGLNVNHRIWTSGHQIGRFNWLWITGEYMIFSDWGAEQPSTPKEEHCMAIIGDKWHDLPCYWVRNSLEDSAFICEERNNNMGDLILQEADEFDARASNYYYRKSYCTYRAIDMLDLVVLDPADGKKYLFADQISTWMEASYFCNAHGMDLVTIETEQENGLIIDYITSLGLNVNHYFWTSAHSIGRSTWLWINGDYVLFSAWGSGQPDNAATDHCMAIFKGVWNDIPCDYLENTTSGERTAFICEERKTPIAYNNMPSELIPKANYYPAELMNLVTLDNGKKYLFANQFATWFEASYFCNAHGMDLATIETEQENSPIMEYLADHGFNKSYAWASAHKIGRTTWLWINGEYPIFTDWQPGQPERPWYELCLVLVSGNWWDWTCAGLAQLFVCEARGV